MKIEWSAEALEDLEATVAYIDLDRPTSAQHLVQTVFTAVDRLAEFPNLGHVGRRKRTRELVFGDWPYILAYAVKGDIIYILRLVHMSRRWPRISISASNP